MIEIWAAVGHAPRLELSLVQPRSSLYLGALGPGWAKLTDRANLALPGSRTVTVGTRQRIRLPRGLVQENWRVAAHGHDQALIVVQRHASARGAETYVDVLTTELLAALLDGVVLPQHAADWPVSR